MRDPLDPAADDPEFRGQGGVTDAVLPRVHGTSDLWGGGEIEPDRDARTAEPVVGSSIDRYVVLRRLGQTRHAEIYAAHDPELDRTVAVKLLSSDVADEVDGFGRMRAEAQASARLTHPNVVKIHDVGSWRGRPYIAREFIEGGSARRWKQQEHPSQSQVLRVMLQAGRGVAALHAAGLVHRDLNPRAIFVGEDGNVRVTDMDYVGSVDALALPSVADGDASVDSRDPAYASQDPSARSCEGHRGTEPRTAEESGLLADSPYAAPEQLLGRAADARSDQFSFCVVLYEALYDAMPFGRGTGARRLSAMERGRVRVPEGKYSRRTLQALRRGLAADPTERFAGMAALLDALTPRRVRAALLAPLAVGVLGVAGMALVSSQWEESRCASVEYKLQGVWDTARAETLRVAFRATKLPYADDVRVLTQQQLDQWGQEWVARHNALCLDRAAGADVTEIAREMHCLSLRRGELAAVVDALTVGDVSSVENATRIVRELRSVRSCADPDQWLRSHDQIDEATQLGRGLVTLSTLMARGRAEEGLPLADELVEAARTLGHRPSLVRAMGMRAQALDIARRPGAEAALHEAFSEALASADYVAVASVATTIASRLARARSFDEAERWLDHAEASLDRQTDARTPGMAAVETTRGRIAALQGDFESALSRYRRAQALRVEDLGPDDDRVGLYRVNVGQVLQDLGRNREARVEFEEALRTLSRALGSEHPNVAKARMALGASMSAQGEYEAGLEHGREALRILTGAYGKKRVIVADAMVAMAMAHSGLGHAQDSIDLQHEAIEIYRATTGDRSFRVALALNNLGVENYNTGRYVDAEAFFRSALERMVEKLGLEHLRTAAIRASLIDALLSQSKYEEVVPLMAKVQATIEDRASSDIPLVAYWLTSGAELEAVQGHHGAAVEKLERAVEIMSKSGSSPGDLGEMALMLASELRYEGRGSEADLLRAETMAILQARGADGALAIREAGRFARRVEVKLAGELVGGSP